MTSADYFFVILRYLSTAVFAMVLAAFLFTRGKETGSGDPAVHFTESEKSVLKYSAAQARAEAYLKQLRSRGRDDTRYHPSSAVALNKKMFRKLSKTDDPEKRGRILCKFVPQIVEILVFTQDTYRNEQMTPGDRFYYKALFALYGITENGEKE